MLDFYEVILNIKKWDTNKVLSILNKLIENETKKVDKYVDNYEGLCKVFSNNIYKELTSLGLNTIKVDLKELYKELPSHEFLILHYQDETSKFNYILIDPTYSQFVHRKDETSPLYFEAWPSQILQNINPNLLKNILKDKYSYIDNKNLKDYISSFTNKKTNIDLETIIVGKYKDRKKKI